jgi:outer membrane protein TolC
MLLRSFLPLGVLLLFGALSSGGTECCAEDLSEQGQDPATRIRAAVEAAWKHGANLAETEARIAAERFAAKVEARAGPPYIEYQREGIDSSFGNALNATKYVRVGKPFNVPWQWLAGKALISATETYAATARQVACLNIALEVGLAWITLAVLEEQIPLQEKRLDRGRQALRLHRKRLEMGEVSGSEVTQVELEHARQLSDLATLRSEREEALLELERLAGKGTFQPIPGDLAQLTAQLESFPADEEWHIDGLEESPFVKVAHKRTLQGRRSAELEQKLAWGRPEIEVEWEHVPSVEGLEDFDAFGWRIQMPLPVDRSGWESRKESRANLAAVEAQERIIKGELHVQVRVAEASARAADERLRGMEGVVTGLAVTERSLAEQFRLGTISYLVYFDSMSRLEDVILQYIDARRALLQARLELAVLLYDLTLFPLPVPSVENVQ